VSSIDAPTAQGLLADELLERGLVADPVEVGLLLRQVTTPLPQVDRMAEVFKGVRVPIREALAARHVEEDPKMGNVPRISRPRSTASS